MENPFKVGDRVYVRATHCSNHGLDGYVRKISGTQNSVVNIDFGKNLPEESRDKDYGYHFSNLAFYSKHPFLKNQEVMPLEEKDESIWMVVREKGDYPKKIHTTYGAAKSELERLAKANAGHKFYLLEAIEELEYEMKYERKELIYKQDPKDPS